MTHPSSRSKRGTIALGLAALLAALWAIAVLTASDAGAVAATQLGKTTDTPKPLCPDDCQVTGSVTGFQVSTPGQESLFKVPEEGHIVAWSLDLSAPTASDVTTLNSDEFFGGQAEARIGILKSKRKSRYKLTKQSPAIELENHFGSRPIFTLKKPLRVKPGQRVAITLPTWAPLYIAGINGSNEWIASRKSGECEANQILDARPQDKKGSIRSYGCRFPGERLLYWAYFLPSGK